MKAMTSASSDNSGMPRESSMQDAPAMHNLSPNLPNSAWLCWQSDLTPCLKHRTLLELPSCTFTHSTASTQRGYAVTHYNSDDAKDVKSKAASKLLIFAAGKAQAWLRSTQKHAIVPFKKWRRKKRGYSPAVRIFVGPAYLLAARQHASSRTCISAQNNCKARKMPGAWQPAKSSVALQPSKQHGRDLVQQPSCILRVSHPCFE